MNYQEFLNYMKENFIDYLIKHDSKEGGEKNTYSIQIRQIIKNNGIKLDGLIIQRNEENISPNIYLNSYFESYQLGTPLSCIMEEIAKQYYTLKENHRIEIDNLFDFPTVQNRIIVRLVNYERNREMLKDCPYKRFLDMAITFRYMAGRDEYGLASSLITNEEFDLWEIGIDDLYQIALFNTMREFPWHMDSLATVILDCIKRNIPQDMHGEMEEELSLLEDTSHGVNMYVLSNDSDLNGASCILYDAVIRNFARVQDSNVLILPSSIHEVMLVPESEETDVDFLQQLLLDANQSAVGLIDLLSDSIYYYRRDTDEITIYGA